MVVTQDYADFGRCPECNSMDFMVVKERGEAICKKCGSVLDSSMIDFGQDWGFEESGESLSRAGAAFDPRVANNLRTKLGNETDLSKMSGSKRYAIKRLQKKNNWGSAFEANLNNALSNLRLMASYLKLPDRIEKEAANIYRMAAQKGLTRARSSDSIVIASIYLSCRTGGIPKSLKEFSEASKIDKKTISKTYKLIARELAVKLNPASPVDYVGRFASAMDIGPKSQSKAVEMIEKAQNKELVSGCNPMSVAAACLYLAGLMNKEKRTQKMVSDVSGISEVTLRNKCKEFINELNIKNKEISKVLSY
ncbi:transcription initiation factor IIB family protein [Candidatus Woesearchaeota archaeon]|nr:transcription initiation factor IIB family protein [Candidatus Woesearchaeota archaeon]